MGEIHQQAIKGNLEEHPQCALEFGYYFRACRRYLHGLLSEKYRPQKIASLVGNEQPRLQMVKWLKHWKIGSKPLLLLGPPGVGKSTSIYALAKEFGYSIIELNASDVRTRDRLREEIGPSLENKTLFSDERLLIFLDEIDGISGRADFAGMDFIMDFVENARVPVAMAANVEDLQKLKKLQQKSLALKFRPIGEDLVQIYLRCVANREGIEASDSALGQVARNSRGDVRQALNNLQTLSGQRVVGGRTDDQFLSDSEALDAILSSKTFDEELAKLRQFDAPPIEKIRSMFDAVVSAKNLSVEARSEALELLSQADMIYGRISRTQSWRLLRYIDKELALATFGKNLKKVDSSLPWNLRLSIWNDGRVVKEMLSVLSEKYHVGKSDFATFFLPYFAYYFRANLKMLPEFLEKNGFEDSEKRVLLKLARKP